LYFSLPETLIKRGYAHFQRVLGLFLCFITICWVICKAQAGQTALDTEDKKTPGGGIERKSTRTWAQEIGYDAEKLFNKVSLLSYADKTTA